MRRMTMGSVALVAALSLAGCADDEVVNPDDLIEEEETTQTEDGEPTEEPDETQETE